MASAGARAYNGGLEAEPPAGVQEAEPPVGGQGGEAPLKLTVFYVWTSTEVRLLCASYVLGVNHRPKGFSE